MQIGRWAVNDRKIIGTQDNPMLERWRLLSTPWGGVYVHFIYREDLDRDPHDHPWTFWSMVLRGGYTEEVYTRPGEVGKREAYQVTSTASAGAPDPALSVGSRMTIRIRPSSIKIKEQRRFRLHRFPLHHAHRITHTEPMTTTLVLVGPKVREWGFYVGAEWVRWQDYLKTLVWRRAQ